MTPYARLLITIQFVIAFMYIVVCKFQNGKFWIILLSQKREIRKTYMKYFDILWFSFESSATTLELGVDSEGKDIAKLIANGKKIPDTLNISLEASSGIFIFTSFNKEDIKNRLKSGDK